MYNQTFSNSRIERVNLLMKVKMILNLYDIIFLFLDSVNGSICWRLTIALYLWINNSVADNKLPSSSTFHNGLYSCLWVMSWGVLSSEVLQRVNLLRLDKYFNGFSSWGHKPHLQKSIIGFKLFYNRFWKNNLLCLCIELL